MCYSSTSFVLPVSDLFMLMVTKGMHAFRMTISKAARKTRTTHDMKRHHNDDEVLVASVLTLLILS
jgi:hypothetical protein